MKIWKFAIPTDGKAIKMPARARILSVGVQENRPVLWAMVDPHQTIVAMREVLLFATNEDLPIRHPRNILNQATFIGTVQLHNPLIGELVFHAFDFGEIG